MFTLFVYHNDRRTQSKDANLMSCSSVLQLVTQSLFLVIGYGNEMKGDAAAPPQIARIVANWQLPSIKTIAAQKLKPEFVDALALTDYAIFIEACNERSRAKTVQLNPMVVNRHSLRPVQQTGHCSSLDLLNLSQQFFGRSPQAWLLKVPVENLNPGTKLSSTTQRGADQAVRKIEQFLRTYQQPSWISPSASRKSA